MGEFYNPEGITSKHGAKLPHWQQAEVMQFVTIRLGDAMPRGKLMQWKEDVRIWRQHHAWVIMPNHAHLLFTPHAPLDRLIKPFVFLSFASHSPPATGVWRAPWRDP